MTVSRINYCDAWLKALVLTFCWDQNTMQKVQFEKHTNQFSGFIRCSNTVRTDTVQCFVWWWCHIYMCTRPFSSLTHSCCFSLVLMWPSSSSSLCSFWHRFLCWARKRKTVTLGSKINRERNKWEWKKQRHPVTYMTNKQTSHLYTYLLSAALCCSISFSKLFLCSIKLSMFWRQSFSSSLEK